MLNFQLALVENSPRQEYYKNIVFKTAESLSRLLNVKAVANQKTNIMAAKDEVFWENNSHSKIESIRVRSFSLRIAKLSTSATVKSTGLK